MKLFSRILLSSVASRPVFGLKAGLTAVLMTGLMGGGGLTVSLSVLPGTASAGQSVQRLVSGDALRQLAALNAPPDKGTLYEDAGTSFEAISVSPGGRVVAALDTSAKVHIYDAFDTGTFANPDEALTVSLKDCSDPIGVFVASNGVVQVPCAGGTINQFTVSENSDTTKVSGLTVSTPTSLDTDATSFTTATIDSSGINLYLAGVLADSTDPVILTMKATGTGAAPSSFGSISDSSASLQKIALQESGSILAAAAGGNIYTVSGPASPGVGISCTGANPTDLLIVNSVLALMVSSGSSKVYAIQLEDGAATDCDPYDWGLASNPSALTKVSTASGNYIYVRAKTSAESEVAVYAQATVEQSYADLDPISTYVVKSGSTVNAADPIASNGGLGMVFVGASNGLVVLQSGPVLTLSGLSAPLVLTEEAATAALTITSDEASEDNWYDLSEPSTSSTTGTEELGVEFVADTAESVDVDFSPLGLQAGLNSVYLYAKDASGNIGFTAVRVNYVSVPAMLEDFEVKFGDRQLYLYFTPPDDETVDGYEILVHYESFEAPESDSLPTGWTTTTPNFEVNDTSYPGSGGWPMELNASTDTDVWSTAEDGRLKYALKPLINGVTYYVTVRATASGVGGDWTAVKSKTPEETCGAACIAEDVGGFCSYAPTAERDGAGRTGWSLGLLTAVAGLAMRRRRQGGR